MTYFSEPISASAETRKAYRDGIQALIRRRAEELETRKAEMPIRKKTNIKGALARYASMVSSADKGAVINQFK